MKAGAQSVPQRKGSKELCILREFILTVVLSTDFPYVHTRLPMIAQWDKIVSLENQTSSQALIMVLKLVYEVDAHLFICFCFCRTEFLCVALAVLSLTL